MSFEGSGPSLSYPSDNPWSSLRTSVGSADRERQAAVGCHVGGDVSVGVLGVGVVVHRDPVGERGRVAQARRGDGKCVAVRAIGSIGGLAGYVLRAGPRDGPSELLSV